MLIKILFVFAVCRAYRNIPAFRRRLPLELALDNGFTNNQRLEILQASHDWNQATGVEMFHMVTATAPSDTEVCRAD